MPIDHYQSEATPALDHYSWKGEIEGMGYPSVGAVRQMLDKMHEDNVPPDAAIQISGPFVYAFWKRDARPVSDR